MNYYKDIIYRLRAGESERSISRDLSLSRPTVHKYKEKAEMEGYLTAKEMPREDELAENLGPTPKPPKMISSLEDYRETVQKYVDQEIEMTAILQRLREQHGYQGSYSAVRRFVHQLRPSEVEAFVRVHREPGEEMQVDFGSVGNLYDPISGKIRPAYAFVATLSYSRHQYAELVFDQKISTWLNLHQHCFEFLGGVPQRIVLDNLKAGVILAAITDPILGEAYRDMARHFRFIASPNKPRTPQHKGKVENGVHYLKRNFMAGQEFVDIQTANRHLKTWIMEIAGARDHGTTHQAPYAVFQEYEQAALTPLPEAPFTLSEIRMSKVHSDCHIVVDQGYYSVPYVLVGKEVEVHIHERILEIYSDHKLIRTHLKAVHKGQWRTEMEDYPPYKAEYLTKTPAYCRQSASRIGPNTLKVVQELLADDTLDRLRSVQAILGLEKSVGGTRLEAACKRAFHFGDFRYRRIKEILNAALDKEPLPECAPAGLSKKSFTHARNPADFFEQGSGSPTC
jgi:transposase